jgi:hypothetical protein
MSADLLSKSLLGKAGENLATKALFDMMVVCKVRV